MIGGGIFWIGIIGGEIGPGMLIMGGAGIGEIGRGGGGGDTGVLRFVSLREPIVVQVQLQ